MTLHVKLLSAFIRKTDIAAHYPGGCEAFETQHMLGESNDCLYRLISMSRAAIESLVESVGDYGFDTERFVAIADMWVGPIKRVPYIDFTQTGESFPPTWLATSNEGAHHV